MTYLDLFESHSFVSFDISVRSTGWCRYKDGVFSYGSFGLQAKDDLMRRMEFRKNAIDIIGNQSYDFIAIEDVIGGCNFETTKALIQLNSIVDDLIYLGVVPSNTVKRIGNTVWKKYLKEVSQYNGVKMSFGKDEIRNAINTLGFCDNTVQDVYDSIGIAIGVIKSLDTKQSSKSRGRIKTDLTKSYNFYKYDDDTVYELSQKTGLVIYEMEFDNAHRDMIHQFKIEVSEIGDDFVFVLDAPMEKYGVLALMGKLPMGADSRVIAVKRGK